MSLGEGCLIGSRVSVLSGTQLHARDDQGHWTPFEADRMTQITLDPHVWVGEGAIVMADLGEGAMVSAGAVVASPIPSRVMVAGNPARFVKKLASPASPDSTPGASGAEAARNGPVVLAREAEID